MARGTLRKRIDKIAQEQSAANMPLAVICIKECDTAQEAEFAIAARKRALERAGYTGPLIVLDR